MSSCGVARRLSTALLLLGFLFAAVGCTGQDAASTKNQQSPTLQKVLKDKVLKVGIAETIPNAWKDSDGRWRGYNVAVARGLAKELGVKVKFVEAPQNSWIPQLKSGKYDVNMLGWFMTPKRAVEVGFTDPVFVKGYSYVVRKDSPVKSISALNTPKYSVTGLTGGAEETVAQTYTPKAKTEFLNSGSPLEGALAVKAKRSTAWIYPADVVQPFLTKNQWARTLNSKPVWNNPLAYAIRKGDPEWKFFLDSYITKVKQSGELDRWIDQAKDDSVEALKTN